MKITLMLKSESLLPRVFRGPPGKKRTSYVILILISFFDKIYILIEQKNDQLSTP